MCHQPLKWLRDGGSVLVPIATSVSAAVWSATISSASRTAACSPALMGVVRSCGVHGDNHKPHDQGFCPSLSACLRDSASHTGNVGSSVMTPHDGNHEPPELVVCPSSNSPRL